MNTYINHRQVDDYPISPNHDLDLMRGRLGDWIQDVIDAGWRIETKRFDSSTAPTISVQLTTGSWQEGTYRQVGGSHPSDFEQAFLRAFVAWEQVKDQETTEMRTDTPLTPIPFAERMHSAAWDTLIPRKAPTPSTNWRPVLFSNAEIQRIRRVYDQRRASVREIASVVGVERIVVDHIVRRIAYTHVPEEASAA